MPTVTVNNEPVEIGADERLNCIQAAQRAGYEIPAYCYHPALSVVASCRMCLVEYGERKPDGTVSMMPKLVPGCQTPVKDGSVIVADSPKVQAARKATLEYLLLNHPLDCPTCDQAGECFLQDYSFRYGRGYSRLQEPKNIKPDKDYLGNQITLFTDRCIMCTRCVRFTREVSGTAELQVINRGSAEEIDIFPGDPCNNKLAGNVVDLCPVGALCSKDFLYQQRVWWLQSAESVCTGCSTGCSIHVDQNDDQLYRLRPRVNPESQGHFMCDDGRFGWKYVHSEERLTMPEFRSGGQVVANDWDSVLEGLRHAFSDAAQKSPGRIAAVLSPFMAVEEAYLLARYIKTVDAQASLFLGPVPVVGEDDTYPKDVHGQPSPNVKFTIRAEKCPNRRGVELVLNQLAGGVSDFETALQQMAAGKFDAVYLVGGDPHGWMTAEQAKSLAPVRLVVVQDLLPSPAIPYATFVLPSGSFAEREGTYINHAGLVQEFRRAMRGPDDSRPDGRLLWELNERPGMFRPTTLREEIVESIPEFGTLKISKCRHKGMQKISAHAAAPAVPAQT